jgi:hypothetical protein
VTLRQPAVVATDPSSSFVCDYPAGVNRVLSLPPYLLIDNIGRNVELWHFQPGDLEPSARALFDLTSYPGDPIASLLDVDLHAAFVRGDGRELLTVNHYGCVRGFELPAPSGRLQPAWERHLRGDTERIVMAGSCFIASSPRGEFTDDRAQPGIFLFEPLGASPAPGLSGRLNYDQALADWGVISALAVSAAADRLAVASARRLGVFALTCGRAGVRLGDCLWEAPLGFHGQWLHFDGTECLWAGGYRPVSSATAGEVDCRGGGIAVFALDGRVEVVTPALPEATAWGYGADPIVVAADCRHAYVLGRDGSLHVADPATGVWRQLYDALEAEDGGGPSLGIGHAAVRDGWLYAGFSRGGFRLLRYAFVGT